MIVYFSTVFRTAPIEQGGELIKLDWKKKEVLARVPISPPEPMIPDPNPRGGTRGGRGILLRDGKLVAASYHTLHEFDRDLRPTRTISHPWFADVHELAWDGDDIWASSTVIDAAVKIDLQGNTVASWWPREDPVIAGKYDLPELPLEKDKDCRLAYLGKSHVQPGHTHLNTVSMLDGRPLILLNQFGCVVQLNPTRILIEDSAIKGAHNIVVTRDRHVLINDTVNQTVRAYDIDGRLKNIIKLARFWIVRKIRWRFALRMARLWLGKHSPSFKLQWMLVGNIIASRPVFVRGLCETGRGTILVGISPATLLEIDWRSGKLVDSFTLSKDVNIAVHGLVCTD